MFLASGTLVESVEAKAKTLEYVLKKYASKKFTGYVVYRNERVGVDVYIAMVEGNITACRALRYVFSVFSRAVRTILVEGASCCNIATEYINRPEGTVEVYSAERDEVLRDLLVFPLSRVEEVVELAKIVGTGVGVSLAPPTPTPPVEVAKPPLIPEKPLTPVVEAPPSIPQVKQVKPPEVPPRVEETRAISPRVEEECIDPLVLFSVIRSSKLVEVVQEPLSAQSILQKVVNTVSERKPKHVYISGNAGKALVRVLFNAQDNATRVQVEENGVTKCGKAALEALSAVNVVNTKVWVVP